MDCDYSSAMVKEWRLEADCDLQMGTGTAIAAIMIAAKED
jgi:hypothetical protein